MEMSYLEAAQADVDNLHIPIYSTYVHTDVHGGQAGRHDLWKLLADAKSANRQIINGL